MITAKRITELEDSALVVLNAIVARYEGDTGELHGEADDLLLALLKELGFERLVEAFQQLEKWYS